MLLNINFIYICIHCEHVVIAFCRFPTVLSVNFPLSFCLSLSLSSLSPSLYISLSKDISLCLTSAISQVVIRKEAPELSSDPTQFFTLRVKKNLRIVLSLDPDSAYLNSAKR